MIAAARDFRIVFVMAADEDDTHSRLQQLRAEVLLPILAEHSGHLVKETGDGYLASFQSPDLATSKSFPRASCLRIMDHC